MSPGKTQLLLLLLINLSWEVVSTFGIAIFTNSEKQLNSIISILITAVRLDAISFFIYYHTWVNSLFDN